MHDRKPDADEARGLSPAARTARYLALAALTAAAVVPTVNWATADRRADAAVLVALERIGSYLANGTASADVARCAEEECRIERGPLVLRRDGRGRFTVAVDGHLVAESGGNRHSRLAWSVDGETRRLVAAAVERIERELADRGGRTDEAAGAEKRAAAGRAVLAALR